MSEREAAAARLWLDAMHAIGRPLAHEVKNALNGLSVNLEVVRSRASVPEAQAAGITRFADAAAEQLGVVTSVTESLLDMVRPAPPAAGLVPLVERLGVLLRAIARPDGGEVRVEAPGDPVPTALGGAELRAVVAGLLVGAFERTAKLSCEVGGGAEPTLRLARDGAALPDLPDEVRRVATRAGVRLELNPASWTATFPARDGQPAEPNHPAATHA
ncbi:MAG TPA: hypothetical protein VFX39_07475 [Gemmatimonadaceae bacterium]|nr:hypothetical protein [Gemmatimonadaceae bacterium]